MVDENEEVKWDGPDEVSRMTREDRRQFVRDMIAGRVFTSAHLTANSPLGMVFFPVIMGAFDGAPSTYLESVGVLWEYMSKAGPRSINGAPMFLSMSIMHKKDWEMCLKSYQDIQKKIDDSLGEPAEEE